MWGYNFRKVIACQLSIHQNHLWKLRAFTNWLTYPYRFLKYTKKSPWSQWIFLYGHVFFLIYRIRNLLDSLIKCLIIVIRLLIITYGESMYEHCKVTNWSFGPHKHVFHYSHPKKKKMVKWIKYIIIMAT